MLVVFAGAFGAWTLRGELILALSVLFLSAIMQVTA